MINFKEIRVNNFILRHLKDSDKERKELFSILNDPTVQKYLPGFYLSTQIEIEHTYIIASLTTNLFLVIEDVITTKIIGIIFVHSTDNYARIYYVIAKERKGENIIPDVLKRLIEYLYDNKLFSALYFSINISNKSSIRVMQKLNISVNSNENDSLEFYLPLTEEELPF